MKYLTVTISIVDKDITVELDHGSNREEGKKVAHLKKYLKNATYCKFYFTFWLNPLLGTYIYSLMVIKLILKN